MRKEFFLVFFVLMASMYSGSALTLNQTTTFYTYPLNPILVIGGTKGSGQGQFNEPDSVYVDQSGTIFAGDTSNLRVQVFDKDGNFLREFTGFTSTSDHVGNEVQGIGELSDGTIVVIEKAANLYFFDKTGSTPKKVVALPDPGTDEQPRDTQGLVVDTRNDTIFITDQPNNKVLVFDGNGQYLREFSTGLFSTPENMVIDPTQDIIYVSLEGKREIGVFSLNGTLLTTFGKDYATGNYEGLALDPSGNIIAVDEGPDELQREYSRIIIFNKTDYSPIAAFGSYAGNSEGRFLSPDGVAYDYANNRVIVADQGNYRLQVFDYNNPVEVYSTGDTVIYTGDLASAKIGFYLAGALFGGTYTLQMNGTTIDQGTFKYGQFIKLDISSLGVGTYVYSMNATDGTNDASASLTLQVTNQKPTTTTNAPTGEKTTATTEGKTPFALFGAILAIVSSSFILKRKRR